MNIRRKITIGFALPIVLLLTVGVLARMVANRLATTTSWVERSLEIDLLLQRTLTRVVDAETGARAFFLVPSDAFLEPFVTSKADVTSLLDRASDLSADNQAQHDRVMALRTAVFTRVDILTASVQRRRTSAFDAEAAASVLEEGKHAMDQVRDGIKQAIDAENTLLSSRRSAASEAVDLARTALTVVVLVGAVGALIASLLIARSILIPIQILRDGVERIGTGERDFRIVTRANDETGELAKAFNTMVDRRRASEDHATEMADQRARVLERVSEIANQLATAAEELHATTSSQASGAQQQSAAVAETTTIVEEVVQTSAQAAERAQQVAELSREAAEAGSTGQHALDTATVTMENAKDKANKVAASILSLAEQAQSIEDIVTSVDDIAEQSNLLALNAALEAARAGDRGRGFAVVATEMRSLAEQSKASTVQVRRMLGAIQKQSNEAVLMTEASTRGIDEAARAADSVGQALRTLAAAVGTASQAVAQIAASARQQSGGLQQINQAMRDVASVATQNLATTRQVGQAARDLTALGSTLRDAFAESGRGRG